MRVARSTFLIASLLKRGGEGERGPLRLLRSYLCACLLCVCHVWPGRKRGGGSRWYVRARFNCLASLPLSFPFQSNFLKQRRRPNFFRPSRPESGCLTRGGRASERTAHAARIAPTKFVPRLFADYYRCEEAFRLLASRSCVLCSLSQSRRRLRL